MKTGPFNSFALSVVLLSSLPLCAGAQNAAPSTNRIQNAEPAAKPRVAQRLSAGLDDIVKLTKAGVDESVILAFVQSSAIAYRPSAQEIVRLRENGVTSPVIAALLRRGEDLREKAAARRDAANSPPNPTVAPAPPPVTPSPPTSNPPSATVIVAPTPQVVYSSVVYPAYYRPAYYSAAYGYGSWRYPGYYSSSCYSSFGYRGWHHRGSFSVRVGGYGYRGGFRHCR